MSDNGTSDYMVQTLLEFPGEIESLFIVGDFNTALSEMNRFSRCLFYVLFSQEPLKGGVR